MQLATLGGGCFWCMEAVFLSIEGVKSVQSGYSGGDSKDATYKKVSTGRTSHAEVVQLTFDPEVITYREILEVFFNTHDPTTLNRQGADVGSQYRSVIFYHSEDQKETAINIMDELAAKSIFDDSIVTQLEPYEAFYLAEEYHQNYYERNRDQAYCRMVIDPKMQKFYQHFKEKLKK